MAVVKLAPRLLLLSIVAIGILSCFSFENSGEWSIKPVPTPSQGAAFYVLNNWQETYSADAGEIPALGLSDIMLKTMGILKDGVSWPGVEMSNLFSRPHATALFVVDRLPATADFGSLSEHSYPVDQSGLCACPQCAGEDLRRMFGEEGVAPHLSALFDGHSRTLSVSANERAAIGASAQGSYTASEEVTNIIAQIQDSDLLADYDLKQAGQQLDLQDKVDLLFLSELVLVRQAVETLQDLPAYTSDGAPDVFIFTFSTLRAMELKYGAGSGQLKLAVQLVKDCIATATKDLVAIYDGRVLVQGLVLEWEYPEQTSDTAELVRAYELLKPHLGGATRESFVSALPNVQFDRTMVADSVALCVSLKDALRPSYTAVCPSEKPTEKQFRNNRVLRQADEGDTLSNNTLKGIVEERSEDFAAIFLITLFLIVSLGLALFAVSWAMWTMDPGRDSIIYRQVSDPTT